MTRPASSAIRVQWVTAPATPDLALAWQTLEARADPSFFLSWTWIGGWLLSLEADTHPMLLRATRGGEVVGLGLLVKQSERRLKFLPLKKLHLHATGDPTLDVLTIEHNGLLVQRTDRAEIEAAMYTHLLARHAHWEDLILPGLSVNPFADGSLPEQLELRLDAKPTYTVDLAAVRQAGGDPLAVLSSNTRQQIRRSIKAYEKLGPLTVGEPANLATAFTWLEALKRLHERRWVAKGETGAFANPRLDAFHLRLVETAFPRGEVQLLRVQAGEHDIGYLYSFVHKGRVLFYQSGFDYELAPQHGKPGLVTHLLSIRHNAALGHDVYDFLAGAAQYKTSLSTHEQPMFWATVHRKTIGFHLEESARAAHRRLKAMRGTASSDTVAPTTVAPAGDAPADAVPAGDAPAAAATIGNSKA